MSRKVTIAAAAYAPDYHDDWSGLAAKLERWVVDAAGQGAGLLVFPEYGSEAGLVGACPRDAEAYVWAEHMARDTDVYVGLLTELAKRHSVYILTASGVVATEDRLVNRAHLIGPDGRVAHQDKVILTPFERNEMRVQPGETLSVFETEIGSLGILICYDSEFPILARNLVEAGAEILLVPSATEFPAGFTRVRQSARARAIENQCLVIHSPVLGRLTDCDILDGGTGRVGFFCPPDYGLPPDGILAQGAMDEPGWTIAEVDLDTVSAARTSGQVGNFGHWPEQMRFGRPDKVRI